MKRKMLLFSMAAALTVSLPLSTYASASPVEADTTKAVNTVAYDLNDVCFS